MDGWTYAARYLPLGRPESLAQLGDVEISFEEPYGLPSDESEQRWQPAPPSPQPRPTRRVARRSEMRIGRGTRRTPSTAGRRLTLLLESNLWRKFRSGRKFVKFDAINRDVDLRYFQVSLAAELVNHFGAH